MNGGAADLAVAKEIPFPLLCRALFRLSKPRIVSAISLSGGTAMVLAGGGPPSLRTGAACLLSLFLTAAGSAMINTVLEHDVDTVMERVVKRRAALSIAGMRLTVASALILIGAGLGLSAGALGPTPTLLLGAGVFGYTVFYTHILKRRTCWAAVLGGLPGALPVLVGGAAVSPHPDRGTMILFLIMLLWQPPHFWLLALSRQNDYRAARLPVLPLARGVPFTRGCILLSVLLLSPTTLLLVTGGCCSRFFAPLALIAGLSFFAACLSFTKSEKGFRSAFRCSIFYLLVIFTGVIADVCLNSR